MIVSRYSNSSVCATNIQTEAKMENAIYNYHYCLHLGADSLDKSLLFKECIVLVFNWQTPGHFVCISDKIKVLRLQAFHHKIPLSGDSFHITPVSL